jgi:hypothetical protein
MKLYYATINQLSILLKISHVRKVIFSRMKNYDLIIIDENNNSGF